MRARLLLVFALLFAGWSVPAQAQVQWIDYTPEVLAEALAGDKPVLVDVHADWCSTCALQQRRLNALFADNSAYGASYVTILVDWDARPDFIDDYDIPRRSTLVVFANGEEVTRTVAGTRRSLLAELLNEGLRAAGIL